MKRECLQVRERAPRLLVAGEDPEADAGGRQVGDGRRHACLQLVLDGRAAQQLQARLDRLCGGRHGLRAPGQRRTRCGIAVRPPARRARCVCKCVLSVAYTQYRHFSLSTEGQR